MAKEKMNKYMPRTLAIIALTIILVTIPLTLVLDFVAMHDAILQFIGGLFASVVVTIILFGAFLVSLVLIFGIIILKNQGFWPLKASLSVFKQILGSITVEEQAIQLFMIFRIIVIVICVAVLIIAIIAKVKVKKENVELKTKEMNSAISLSKAAIVLSIIGLVLSSVMMLLVSLL